MGSIFFFKDRSAVSLICEDKKHPSDGTYPRKITIFAMLSR
jgi:hypothetical protein